MEQEKIKEKKSNVLKIILIILLVILIILLLLFMAAFAWFWFADPLGLKTAIFEGIPGIEGELPAGYDHPLLSDEQEKLLQDYGIDPRVVPTEITPEMESCAREALGDERVNQILRGATPTVTDLLRAQSCF